tara:strand:+ start:546 stop:731 length:186 start_codon:yes stop_codon:yes gene_type:complete
MFQDDDIPKLLLIQIIEEPMILVNNVAFCRGQNLNQLVDAPNERNVPQVSQYRHFENIREI